MRSLVAAVGIALALAGCEANLTGARCPCIEPEYTCDVPSDTCVPTRDLGDASQSPDGNLTPDGGFPDGGALPDGGFLPDSGI